MCRLFMRCLVQERPFSFLAVILFNVDKNSNVSSFTVSTSKYFSWRLIPDLQATHIDDNTASFCYLPVQKYFIYQAYPIPVL